MNKPIGKTIAELRKKRKMTQARLAELVYITPVYLSYIENGHYEPSQKLLRRLEVALGYKFN